MPDNLEEIDKSICDKILVCEITKKNYKIIPQEFNFYKKFNLPLPRRCPEERYKNLLTLHNPTKLRSAICSSCGKQTQTTYPLNADVKILCEECYLKTFY